MCDLAMVTVNASRTHLLLHCATKKRLTACGVTIDLARGVWTWDVQPGRVFSIGSTRVNFNEHKLENSIVMIFCRMDLRHLEGLVRGCDWPLTEQSFEETD